MNRVELIGRLTRDPDLRYSPNNVPYVLFTLAIDRPFGQNGQQGNQQGNQQTDFINCIAWNRTAELIKQYIPKGRQIAIEGSIQTSSYDDKNGQRQYRTDVAVSRMEFLGSRQDNQSIGSNPFDNAPQNNYPQQPQQYNYSQTPQSSYQTPSYQTQSSSQKEVTPYDFSDNNQGQNIPNDPYAEFGNEIKVDVNDDELPF